MPYALCPMPYALCPVVPHLCEKGYSFNFCQGFRYPASLRSRVSGFQLSLATIQQQLALRLQAVHLRL